MTSTSCSQHRLKFSKDLSLLKCFFVRACDGFNGEEDDHCMRSTTAIISREPIVESNRPFLLQNFQCTIRNALEHERIKAFASDSIESTRRAK
jgi:hypothetical protein